MKEVLCILTHQRQQPPAPIFRWMLVDQCLGAMEIKNGER
jgi:hypothetical protein